MHPEERHHKTFARAIKSLPRVHFLVIFLPKISDNFFAEFFLFFAHDHIKEKLRPLVCASESEYKIKKR